MKVRLALAGFAAFLVLVIYTADVGAGPRHWGWLSQVPLGDKFGHFGLMSTLTVLTNLSLRCRRMPPRNRTLLLGTVVVSAIVLAEEVSQIWIPGRDFELLDLSADALGISGGDLLARRLQDWLMGRSTDLLEAGDLARPGV
jgi:hypothetical protein